MTIQTIAQMAIENCENLENPENFPQTLKAAKITMSWF